MPLRYFAYLIAAVVTLIGLWFGVQQYLQVASSAELVQGLSHGGAYRQEVTRGRMKRVGEVREALLLVGNFRIPEGMTSVGSAPDNSIVLPADAAPPHLGVILREGRLVKIAPSQQPPRSTEEQRHELRFPSDKSVDQVVGLGGLDFRFIVSGASFTLQVRRRRPTGVQSEGLSFYPVDQRYRVVASWHSYWRPMQVFLPTQRSGQLPAESPGYASFCLESHCYRLQAINLRSEGVVRFVFADATNGVETYSGGRYLDASLQNRRALILDFNKAVTPPCAYTRWDTCGLAPEGNRLPIALTAGEQWRAPGPGR